MMLSLKLVLVAATSVLGVALPEPTAAALLNVPPVNCGKVNNALSVLNKLGPPATSFCRSYIKVPATSTTKTITTAPTVTSTTSTTTVTVTSAQCPGKKRDVAAAHADYDIERSEEASWVVQKRTNILPQLQMFAAAKVSEACSCLCLTPTATTTLTSTAPAPTTNVVATATACVVEQPVCKPAGLSSTCASGSECCTGRCGTSFETSTCCNPSNEYCDLNDPGACCGGTCISLQTNNLDGYCL